MAEQKIQASILNLLKAKGAYTVKVMAANRNGVPDILACYKGRFIAIEVKDKGNKATPLQLANIEQIKEQGGYALVAYSPYQVELLLGEIDESI